MRAGAKRLKLKARVTLALVALVTLFVAVQGVLAYWSLAEQEDDLAEEYLLAEARRLVERVERAEIDGPRAADLLHPAPALSAWLVTAEGATLPGPLPERLRGLGEGPHRFSSFSLELHVAVVPTARGLLYVQYDASAAEAKVERFGLYLLGLAVLCIVLTLAVARRVAALALAPIDRVTRQLTDWAPDSNVATAAESDEESRLADAFRRVQSRFEAAIARERELVSNIRHEIRTPLAALRTDLEMLAFAEAPDSPRHERLQRALAGADALTATLETARVMTRSDRSASTAVDLSRCVEDAWSSLGAYPGIGQLEFVNSVPAGTVVNVDRHALLTILRNLIRNAIEHAAPARCVVRCTDRGIEVADDGPGIPAEDLPFVFERYYRGRLADSPGIAAADRGIGLAIARQVADLNGWSLIAASTPGEGARFVLNFP
jgi:signal transduction histidine kinase